MSIRWGCSSRAKVSPASASVVLSTVWPTDCSRNVTNVILAGLSSITRMVAISGHQTAPAHRAPDFGREQIGVESRLLHDGRHMAIEPDAVIGREVLGGNHQDWDTGGLGTFGERGHYIKTVHVRHHQIQHDHIRQITAAELHRLP